MILGPKQWEIFTEKNAPMHEPWTYGVSAGDGKIFIAAWGGGVIEYTKNTKHFKDYTDPDGEMEIDLLPDDGVVHDITTATTWGAGYLWVSTYFGLSSYDGTHWKGYFKEHAVWQVTLSILSEQKDLWCLFAATMD